MATPNSSTVSLKLLIDSKDQKVLFTEAGKDFVDFLFTLLSLPVGTVIRLLSKDGMVGSVGKLYESVENLDDTYMQPNFNKVILLKPKAPVAGPNILGLLTNAESPARKVYYMCLERKVYYRCPESRPNNMCCIYKKNKNKNIKARYYDSSDTSVSSDSSVHPYVTEDPTEECPSCHSTMSSQVTYVGQPKTTGTTSGAGAAGYVKDVVTYMIMDDLEVKPISTISSITLLNRFNVKDVGALEERVVGLSMDEGVKLLKESLQSKSVLTNVFLGKKAAA